MAKAKDAQSPSAPPPPAEIHMTARQVQVFRLVVCGGQGIRAVAKRLEASHTTIRRELQRVLNRLELLGIRVTWPAGSNAQGQMTTNWDSESWGL